MTQFNTPVLLRMVNLLLRKVSGILNTPHSTKHTCLHFAARNGHNSILQLLIDKGLSINTTCNTGSCLHEAALHGRIETVAYVLDRNIDVYLTNSLGQTVLEAIQSLAASLCRSRIQQLISDHICHKVKLGVGNRKNTRSYHNGLSTHTTGFRMEGVDDSNAFQRSSSFIVKPSQAMFPNMSNTPSGSSSNNSSYSAPYQELNTRDPPTSKAQQNQYSNDAIMYTRKVRGLADTNIHYDDDVTHAPLSVIRKPNNNLPVSLHGNGIYYYQTPSAKFNPSQEEFQSLPSDFTQHHSNRKRDSTSSDDYFARQERDRHDYDISVMGGALQQFPDLNTSESEFDEASVDSSSHNSYDNLANLYTKKSAPLVKLNPAHSLFADLLSDEPSEGEQEIYEVRINNITNYVHVYLTKADFNTYM
ncbi:Caskin-1-like isoform X2 [Oopsacas minuta]|uniref:Caskin-1-like isoform X2 n=1 Tax=Oopsacas minuta TaxID=111878 RepID=A0AAV7JI14_9METZ|nr:Caskin-1-like isoform X2 [Oopsacas minuta]